MRLSAEEYDQQSGKILSVFDKVEGLYLRALRMILLIIATLMILFAIWLGVSGLWGIMKSTDSVVEAPARVEAAELASAELPERADPENPESQVDSTAAYRKFYSDFGRRHFQLYNKSFEPFRQPDDKKLTQSEFVDAYLKPSDRIEAIEKGDLNFESDRADLEGLLATMTEAAKLPQTVERLQKYKRAKRVQVSKQVERFRTETRGGWDPYSTSCYEWYASPVGCAVNRSERVPYTQTIKVMELPKGTQSHADIFRAIQTKYFELLEDRRESNARAADNEKAKIAAANVAGKNSLWTSLQMLGGFLLLMFFFLLIAIERHQRRLSGVSGS